MPHKIDESMARVCGAALKSRRGNGRPGSGNNGKE
jgi:hypothetical protein